VSELYNHSQLEAKVGNTYGEDTTQMVFFINYENTVASLSSHKLGSLYDKNILLDRQSLSGSQSGYSTSDFFCLTHSAGVSTFFGKLLLYFLSNSLVVGESNFEFKNKHGKVHGVVPLYQSC
jgi:hypothetical protein